MHHFEELRESYRPEGVGMPTQVLMIGESPPSGGTFFYEGNSNLFFAVRDAFVRARGTDLPPGKAFLRRYQSGGYHLVDLCEKPVNQLKDDPSRAKIRERSQSRLSGKIALLPKGARIVVLMKAIQANVKAAIRASRRDDLSIDLLLPFPGRPAHRQVFVTDLASFLSDRKPPAAKSTGKANARPLAASTGSGLTLHEELADILSEQGNRWMTTEEMAAEVNQRGRYRKRDGSPVTAFQVHGRTRQYSSLFDRQGSSVRLTAEAFENHHTV